MKNNNVLCEKKLILSIASASPATASGGTIAADIAMPTTFSVNSFFPYANVPTKPLITATRKYNVSGCVRLMISEVRIESLLYNKIVSCPITNAIAIANVVPRKIDSNARSMPHGFNNKKLRENPKNGVINGATTIPPMTIAVLSRSNPREISAEAHAINTKKSILGFEYVSKCFCVLRRMRPVVFLKKMKDIAYFLIKFYHM